MCVDDATGGVSSPFISRNWTIAMLHTPPTQAGETVQAIMVIEQKEAVSA